MDNRVLQYGSIRVPLKGKGSERVPLTVSIGF